MLILLFFVSFVFWKVSFVAHWNIRQTVRIMAAISQFSCHKQPLFRINSIHLMDVPFDVPKIIAFKWSITSRRFFLAFKPLRSRRANVSSKKQSKITSIFTFDLIYFNWVWTTTTTTECTHITNTIKTQLKVFDTFQLTVYGLKIQTSVGNKSEKKIRIEKLNQMAHRTSTKIKSINKNPKKENTKTMDSNLICCYSFSSLCVSQCTLHTLALFEWRTASELKTTNNTISDNACTALH